MHILNIVQELIRIYSLQFGFAVTSPNKKVIIIEKYGELEIFR